MSEEYLRENENEGEEYEENQNEEENGEHPNEEKNEEYNMEDIHSNEYQQKEQKSEKDSKNKKIQKRSNKASSKKSENKTNTRETQTSNAPNKAQMKKYKETSLKAMNYRVDIYKTQEKCTKLEKDIKEKHKKLEKVNKERDNLKNYLNRLEKVMQQKTDTDNNDTTKIASIHKNKNTTSNINKSVANQSESHNVTEQSEEKTNENLNDNKLTISMNGAAPIITMDDGQGNKNVIKSKVSLMKFLYKIYMENQNLKNFQTQVFNLSKNYDDINNILAESISGFQDIAKNTKNEEIINEVNNRLKELKTQVESTMIQKQSEYNTQLEKKEEDINMLVKAYDNVYKEIQQKKSDKLHEQKTIEDLNSQIEILETKLSFLKQNAKKENN